MSENGIDWESIEKTNDQRWIQFKNPLHVKTRFGIRHSDKIFYNGHVETLKIEMEDGIIFTCSNNHKFLVNRDSEEVWVRADELIKDDGIVVFELITKEIRIKNITESGLKPTWDIEVNGVHEYTMENGCVSHNTSSILGNEASYEAQTSNMYLRRVLSGEFIMVNRYLVRDLIKNNLWNDSMRNKIVGNNGSVLNIPEIPDTLKEIYKTVWEVKQKDVIDMAADRGAFIDQTQSMNIFMDPVNFAKLTNMHFYGWGRRPILIDGNGEPIIPNNENIQVISDKDGVAKFYRDKRVSLKTGIYYLRIKSASDAVKFTVTKDESQTKNAEDINCSLDNPEDCIACSA
jgi:ribonucleotide reductase alpha subunit